MIFRCIKDNYLFKDGIIYDGYMEIMHIDGKRVIEYHINNNEYYEYISEDSFGNMFIEVDSMVDFDCDEFLID